MRDQTVDLFAQGRNKIPDATPDNKVKQIEVYGMKCELRCKSLLGFWLYE